MANLTGYISTSWNIAKNITSSESTTWNIAGGATGSQLILWNIAQNIVGEISTNWTIDEIGCDDSLPTNQNPFKHIYVDHLINAPTRIFWDLNSHFIDPLPYSYQLQVGQVGLSSADWTDVGEVVTNNYYANDVTKRLYGKELTTHYRIKLTTSVATYYSQPIPVNGFLNIRDWLLAREITRKELLRFQKYTAIQGWLLKARRSGTLCSCVDTDLGEMTSDNCPDCYGTGYDGGYYPALSCTFFDVSPDAHNEERDLAGRGQIDDVLRTTRYIGYPQLYRYDVFIMEGTDQRFYINKVKNEAELRGVPIVVATELRLAPFTDIIYSFPLT